MKRFIFTVAVFIILGFVIIPALAQITGWSDPTSGPPYGNTAPPINISSTAQTKTGKLGIGITDSPTFQLQVSGNSFFDGVAAFLNGKINISGIYTANLDDVAYSPGAGKVLTDVEGDGTAAWAAIPPPALPSGSWGKTLRYKSPTGTETTIWVANRILFNYTSGSSGATIEGPYADRVGIGANTGSFGFSDTLVPLTDLGQPDSNARLDLAGKIRIRGGVPGTGKVLTSDAAGLASWSLPNVGLAPNTNAGNGLQVNSTNGQISLINCSVSPNQVLQWNGSSWSCISIATVNPGIAAGDTLRWDGSTWLANRIIYNDGTDVVVSSNSAAVRANTKLTVEGATTTGKTGLYSLGDIGSYIRGYTIGLMITGKGASIADTPYGIYVGDPTPCPYFNPCGSGFPPATGVFGHGSTYGLRGYSSGGTAVYGGPHPNSGAVPSTGVYGEGSSRSIHAYSNQNSPNSALYVQVASSNTAYGVRQVGFQATNMFDGGIILNQSGSPPACNAGTRGMLWFTRSFTGVKDSLQVCAKDAADAYLWRTLY